MKPITNIDDPRYVKAMSHPLRVRILAMLDERTASPVELAGWLDASLGTVAYHVRTLERMGLVELVHETRVRGAVEHHYSLLSGRASPTRPGPPPPPSPSRPRSPPPCRRSTPTPAPPARPAGSTTATPTSPVRSSPSTPAAGATSRARVCVCSTRSTASRRPPSERMERNPHSGDTKDVALVMMLFEAARLAVETEGDPVAERRRRHRRPVTPELVD